MGPDFTGAGEIPEIGRAWLSTRLNIAGRVAGVTRRAILMHYYSRIRVPDAGQGCGEWKLCVGEYRAVPAGRPPRSGWRSDSQGQRGSGIGGFIEAPIRRKSEEIRGLSSSHNLPPPVGKRKTKGSFSGKRTHRPRRLSQRVLSCIVTPPQARL